MNDRNGAKAGYVSQIYVIIPVAMERKCTYLLLHRTSHPKLFLRLSVFVFFASWKI